MTASSTSFLITRPISSMITTMIAMMIAMMMIAMMMTMMISMMIAISYNNVCISLHMATSISRNSIMFSIISSGT